MRHILTALAWAGLLASHRAWGQSANELVTPQPVPLAGVAPQPTHAANSKTSASSETIAAPSPETIPDSNLKESVIGENQPPIGGVFGDTPPAACEFCGGGGCLPPKWSVDMTFSIMSLARPRDIRLGANSLPAGPLPAGSTSVTSTAGITTANVYTQYLNDAVPISALETHTPAISNSPSWGLNLVRFLGRDGEQRDHFLDFGFDGFQNYSSSVSVNGSIVPFYDTTPFVQAIPAPPGIAKFYQGSLLSPFPTFLPNIGNQQEQITQIFSARGLNYDQAFNRSTVMSTDYNSTFNEFELNYRIAGHNQPDELVLNPNGRWYRQCQTGYYYSYFFGLKGMQIGENFDFRSSGSQYNSMATLNGAATTIPNYTTELAQLLLGNTYAYTPASTAAFTHSGVYTDYTSNTLLGLQTGGKLEYRLCRWCFDTHGNVGMFMNFARQHGNVVTNFTGTPNPSSYYAQYAGNAPLTNRNDFYSGSTTCVAFDGGFGVGGSYKLLPNLVGHVSYDMLFVGDVARAPEQTYVYNSVPETAQHLINTQGSMFYDGVSFSLEWDW